VAIGAPSVADEVKAIRLGLRRITADKDDRKVLKSAAVTPESAGLRPWREVSHPTMTSRPATSRPPSSPPTCTRSPRPRDAGKDYAEPVQFFARTYLTEGLRDLIDRAVRRLAGDQNASPVINLQTNFGGGKTHSMLALWHLASGTPLGDYPQDVQDMLSETPFGELAAASGAWRSSATTFRRRARSSRRDAGQHDLGRACLAARRQGGIREGRDRGRRPHPARTGATRATQRLCPGGDPHRRVGRLRA
jgi:hypothetical protein